MISIIIPVFNKKDTVAKCLDSIICNDYKDIEIIAVDDGSTDGSLAILKEYAKRGVIIIEMMENKGVSCACAAALARAKGDIVIRTDADTVVPPDWIHIFEKYFRDKSVMAVGGSYRCLNSDSPIALCTNAVDLIFVNLFKRIFLLNRLPGANRAIRKSALLSAGGFNNESDLSEDIGVFLKLKKAGKVIFDPDIIVNTNYPDTIARLWERHYNNGRGIILYLKQAKAWIRPVFMLVFYAVLFCAFFNFFIKHSLTVIPGVFLSFYIFILAGMSAISLFVMPKKRFLFLFVPVIFIIQNTAYTLAAVITLFCKRSLKKKC